MVEMMRIVHGKQDKSPGGQLNDYNLEVYKGDIIYVQGLSGSGIKALLEFLEGTRHLTGGNFYIKGKNINYYRKENANNYHIYIITAGRDLIENMTVAENLEVIRNSTFLAKFFRKRKIENEITEFLKKEKAQISADIRLESLNMVNRLKLSLLKAKLHGAELIVIDSIKNNYEGKLSEELCQMIVQMKKEGTAFLILTEKYTGFAEIADRIQILCQGKDMMEWHEMTKEISGILKAEDILLSKTIKWNNMDKGNCIGLYDYGWMLEKGIWNYLKTVHEDSLELWNRYLKFPLLADQECFDGSTAIVTRESADNLIERLPIDDNIIITIPKRISHSTYGVINGRLKSKIAEEYYKLAHVEGGAAGIHELNRVQRKILSIYRWEIARPKTIILENPCWGMDAEEMVVLLNYFSHLAEKKIRLVCFSNSLEELQMLCDRILVSYNGRRLENFKKNNKNLH